MPGDYKTPSYTIYFDTNTAYSKRPSELVTPRLITAIKSARKLTDVDVRVPEVVLEELIYQQFKVANSTIENWSKNSQTLADVCGTPLIKAPTNEDIEIGIRTKFDAFCNDNAISKLKTPCREIDWGSVVSDSCWRRPPFEKPKSEDDLAEKGFRDRMILETILADISRINDCIIAFISADNLLRKTFKSMALSSCAVEAYSGFDEFVGHLELLAKMKSDKHSKDVLERVSEIFYDPEDPGCVMYSKGVVEYINSEYGEYMARPSILQVISPKYIQTASTFSTVTQPLAATNIRAGDWEKEASRWTPVTDIKVFPSAPVFQNGSNDGRYHWKSTITLVRLLRQTVPQLGKPYGFPEERVKTMDIDVLWSCRIDPATAEFSDLSVDEYQPQYRESFVDADWHTRATYDLPAIRDIH
jgi:hypothetical protein